MPMHIRYDEVDLKLWDDNQPILVTIAEETSAEEYTFHKLCVRYAIIGLKQRKRKAKT